MAAQRIHTQFFVLTYSTNYLDARCSMLVSVNVIFALVPFNLTLTCLLSSPSLLLYLLLFFPLLSSCRRALLGVVRHLTSPRLASPEHQLRHRHRHRYSLKIVIVQSLTLPHSLSCFPFPTAYHMISHYAIIMHIISQHRHLSTSD